MSTNFYWYAQPPWDCCGRPFPRLHIGKSSVGWMFLLALHPEAGINSLEDWQECWKTGTIISEYGIYLPDQMMEAITQRQPHFLRHGHGAKRGIGTWDTLDKEFS